MRVLIHTGDSYPNDSPAAKRMRVFAEVLGQSGHKVTVLAPGCGSSKKFPDVIYCPTVKLRNKTTIRRLLNQISFSFSSVIKSLAAGKADVVLTTSPPALIGISGWMIAKIKHAKLVYDVRDIWPDVAWEMGSFTPKSPMSRVFAFVRNFMLSRADLVTAVSPGKIEKLKAYAPDANIKYITNGLDEKFLENVFEKGIVEKYKLDKNFSCVYIGNIGWAQGLTQLLQLAERAKNESMPVHFYLFGSGVEEGMLKAYAEEHELDNVIFAGRISNDLIYTVLKCADMSFVSLVNENLKDSVPTKLFEALGVGCPVLLASVGDSANILNECRLGIAVPPNDADKLWEAFKKMYEEHKSFLDNRDYALEVIKSRYSRQNAAEQLETELRGIL